MIIYGKNPIIEALKSGRTITEIFIQQGMKDQKFENIIKLHPEIKVNYLSNNEYIKRFGEKTGGVSSNIASYEYKDLNDIIKKLESNENVTLAILDSLEDPHNLGAIMRSADATKVDGIIIGKNRSVGLNATVAKVSTGAIEYVNTIQVTNLVNCINTLKENGYWVIGLELDGKTDFREHNYHGKIVVVIGSEGKGISRLVKENCDLLVKIPMYGQVNSLNASVSASLLFYEIIRSRGN